MRRKIDEELLMYAAWAFLLPLLVMLLLISRAPETVMTSVNSQSADIDLLRSMFAGGRLFAPDAILDIVTRRFYPSFIICLLIGGRLGKFLLRTFFYLRFGLMGLGMHLFVSEHVRAKRIWGCILGFTYALCAVSLTACMEPQIMNLMIVMPFAACFTDSLLRKGTKLRFWLCVASFAFFMTGGLNGIITGIIFVLSLVWLLKGMLPQVKIWPAIKALITSLFLQLPVIIATVAAGMPFINIKEEFLGSTVRFKFFDMLITALDGAPVNSPFEGGYPNMSITVFVLMLLVLFFLNRAVPYKAKFASLLLIVLIPASCAWSLLSSILSVYGNQDTAALTRMAALTVIIFLLAAVSLRNAGTLTRNEVFAAVFALLALVVVANSSSASEVARSTFTIWFSAGAVIFWGMMLLVALQGKQRVVDILSLIGLLLIGINLWYSLKVSGFEGEITVLKPYVVSSESIEFDVKEPLPLYGQDPEYVMVHSDLRQLTAEMVFPERMNTLSRAVSAGDIFTRADAFTVFANGVSQSEEGVYLPITPGADSEVLLRAEEMNFDSPYIVFSTFGGRNVLTETYSGYEVVTELNGPYIKELGSNSFAVSLRQVGTVPSSQATLTLWRVDSNALNALRSYVMPMESYEALLQGQQDSPSMGYITVVTSVAYRPNFEIRVTGPEGRVNSETFNYAGKLAVAFNSVGRYDYAFRITTSYVLPVICIIIWVLSSAVVVYNIFKHSKDDRAVSNA